MESQLGTDSLNVCRTCLEKVTECTGYVQIFESSEKYLKATKDIFEGIESLQLGIAKDDGLPQIVCPKCQTTLASISQFKRQCIDVQQKLTELHRNASFDCITPGSVIVKDEIIEINLNVQHPIYTDNTEGCPATYDIDQHVKDETFDYEFVKQEEDDEEEQALQQPTTTSQTAIKASSENKDLVGDQLSSDTQQEAYNRTATIAIESDESNRLQECDICHQTYKGKRNLEKHKRHVHEIGEYPCSVCEQVFTTREKQRYHTRTHNKNFKCTLCDKSFISRNHADVHERTHSGLKPYECQICGASFAQEYSLKRHILRYTNEPSHNQNNSELRSHLCEICGKYFTLRAHLVYHVRNFHKIIDDDDDKWKYKCSYCPKTFAHRRHRDNHERTHTGLRPFKCKICGKNFGQDSHLRRHILTHSEVRPHACSICGRGFIVRTRLKDHMFAIHKVRESNDVK